jgi:hypothetical protein
VYINNKVDDALFLWFTQERERGSGPISQVKALQLNTLLEGDPNFTASNGWLDRLRERKEGKEKKKKTRQLTTCGKLVLESYCSRRVLQFQNLVGALNLTPEQIYNCDETRLNFTLIRDYHILFVLSTQ